MPFHLPALDHGAVDPSARLYSLRIHGHLGAMVLSAFPAPVRRQHRADTVLTGLLDRSALHDALAEIEALGLDPSRSASSDRHANHKNQMTAVHLNSR
jgi:hypothetical protein